MSTLAVIKRPMTIPEWGMLVALSVLWGGSFFFVEVAVAELPPLTIVVTRVSLAAIVLLAVLRLAGVRLPCTAPVWTAFFAMGLLNNVIPFTLFVWGQTYIASGLASILNATTPLFTVIVAHFLTSDEQMTGGRVIGVLLGLGGVAIIVGLEALQTLGVNVAAQIACLAGAISFALAGVFGRRFKRMGLSPMATACGQVTASTVMLVPLMLAVDRPWTLAAPSAATFLALAGLAVLSTALAYILYFRILASAGATNLLLVTFLIPVTAIALGMIVLGEAIEPRQMVGMALIALGLAAIDGRPVRGLSNRLGPNKDTPARAIAKKRR